MEASEDNLTEALVPTCEPIIVSEGMVATEVYLNEALVTTCEPIIVSEDMCESQPRNIESNGAQRLSHVEEKTYTPDVELKPVVGQLFNSFDEALSFYREYARKSGFEIRKATTEQSKNGDGYSRRYILCNREGKKKKRSFDSLKGRKQQRNRPSHRVQCKACIRLKVNDENFWEVKHFEEKHSHELVKPEDFQFLKSNRRLTYHQKQLIHDVSDINIGPVRAFKVLKQTQGGFDKVGTSKVECKNLKRDWIRFIGESDADMVIEKLNKKKEYLQDFSFEYRVDSEGKLSGLFWADEESKRNYHAFGDVVGFDATYRTNKYFMIFVPFTGIDNHKKCVTFAVGLLSSESIDAYKWLLMAFKTTFGREPTVLVTDQDPAIWQVIPSVFSPSCRHRLCMWHISQKFTDKLGSHMSKTGVLKRLNDLIWNERINPTKFEVEWKSIMDEYDLNSNKWFKDMFGIRNKWIPAYFKDCHLSGLMRTTSRSEGENYFYGLVTNTDLHLVEFVSHFETAMESQRYVQRKNDHDSRYTNPEIKTTFLIEEEASQIFTRTVFFEIQMEIIASIVSCYSTKVEESDGINIFSIKDTDKDIKHSGDFEVSFMKSECTISCSCLHFELTGCLCRHCFYVLRMSGVEHFPRKYVSRRWTKDVVPRLSGGHNMHKFSTNDENEDFKTMIREIYLSVDYCVDRLVSSTEKLSLYRDKQREMMKDVDEDTRNVQPMTNTAFIESVIGVEKRDEVRVKIPEGIRNKGSGPIKTRLIGAKEKAILNAKEGSRRCGRCGQYANHNARTCKYGINESSTK